MRWLLAYLVMCAWYISGSVAVHADCAPIQVTTSLGELVGCRYNYGPRWFRSLYYGSGDAFMGIPFARPPTGELRFARPQRLNRFPERPYNATYFRPACTQLVDQYIPVKEMSEDCLHLNVFSPNVYTWFRYPVMVFIHGGSMQQGHAERYTPEGIVRNLVTRGVVVVTIQYRLNLLGFFTTDTDEFPPNRGMLDQIEALRFVRDEIANFGGDPNRITLFGQSAGAASVAAHLLSPVSQNMFQQAIIQSGGILTSFDGAMGYRNLSQLRAQELCNFTADDWSAGNFSDLHACLQDMDYNRWLALEATNGGWRMVRDDYFLPDQPQNLAARRPKIPVMYGLLKDEWSEIDLIALAENQTELTDYTRQAFESTFRGMMRRMSGDRVDDVLAIYESVYVPPGTRDNDNMAWLRINSDALTGLFLGGLMGREIDWYLRDGSSQVYVYEFTYPSDIGLPYDVNGWRPVFHTEEIPFIFMQAYFWEPAVASGRATASDFDMADFMGQTWTDFAKQGCA
ncbi:Protein Y75B8A.3 [Aphelenchoides avenae]|nr:Protein Y75B8A.3 [Aphelenchus avenae]